MLSAATDNPTAAASAQRLRKCRACPALIMANPRGRAPYCTECWHMLVVRADECTAQVEE